MKKVEKSSSAGTADEQRAEADVQQFSQPIAKHLCKSGNLRVSIFFNCSPFI